MGWDIKLGELDPSLFNRVLQHPEQIGNLDVITTLLRRIDAAGDDVAALYDAQAHLFRFSYRAQLAAQGLRRALRRVTAGRNPGWPVAHDADTTDFTGPIWRIICAPDNRDEDAWRLERQVAERVIRQLRAVGDTLAWKVHRYDRRVILALSRNDPPGPFVGKTGLGFELGAVFEIMCERGNFALLHDLTSILRIMDLTEVERGGRRMLREVKSSSSSSATTKFRKQIRRAERLINAIDGGQPLPGEERTHLWRAQAQLRTHVRALQPLLDSAESQGHAVTRIRDRVVGAVHLLSAAALGDPVVQLEAYTAALNNCLTRHLGAARHHLRAVSADAAARDCATAPWGIYPLPPHQRAALICDYLITNTYMSADGLAAQFRRRAVNAQLLLPDANGSFDSDTDVLAITHRQRRVRIRGAAIYQLLIEFIHTDRFVEAFLELLDTPDIPDHAVLTFSNEKRSWR